MARVTGRSTLLGVTAAAAAPTEQPRSIHLLQRWLPLHLACWPSAEASERCVLSALGPGPQLADGPVAVGPSVEFSSGQAARACPPL